MPHIALVTSSYPDGAPGSEAAGSFVEDFAKTLADKVRVTVIAASSSKSEAIAGNLRVARFAVPRLPLSLLNPLNPRDWLPAWRAMRAGQKAIDEIVETDPPDHVLALWTLPCGYWAERATRERGIPFSTWALGSDIWSLGKLPVIRGILRRVLRRARYRYADGLALAADVERLSGKDCRFLPSTRALPQFDDKALPVAAPYKLAFLGRWHPNKGVDLMLDALGMLNDEHWRNIAEVRVFGGGPLEDHVTEIVQRLQRDGRPVALGGYLDKHGAAELIGWADYLLLPSRIESIPVIFSDAMQLGTPVIATPVGDLPRLHDKYSFGALADAATAAAYAGAVATALDASARAFETGVVQAQVDFNLDRIVAGFVDDVGATLS